MHAVPSNRGESGGAPIEGLLLVNKPPGMTSHDVVQVVRRILGVRRIGHTGTLDPIAEGLLLLLVGPATRHQRVLQGHDKTYEAVVRLGSQTDTADAAGRVVRTAPVPSVSRPQVEDVLSSLEGQRAQVPPAYSAVKVHGRPAYWWTRRQRPVTLASRMVRIYSLTLRDLSVDRIGIRVQCSAGTYVRTLAEEIAERVGTVGHLESLTRRAIGRWSLEQAHPFAWVREASAPQLRAALQPVALPAAAGHVGRGVAS